MIRDRLLDRLGVATEPETVERASLYERARRNAWMFVATVFPIWAALVTAALVATAFPPSIRGSLLVMMFYALAWLIIGFIASNVLWTWGFDRFELVPPWQFREEEQNGGRR